MRRTVTAALVAVSTALTLSATLLAPSTAATGGSSTTTGTAPDPALARAQEALHTATAVVKGDAPRVDGTTALLQLRLSMHALPADQRRQAAEILARPTDNPHDPFGQDNSIPAKRKCS